MEFSSALPFMFSIKPEIVDSAPLIFSFTFDTADETPSENELNESLTAPITELILGILAITLS